MRYAELNCISNFSFLQSASRPEELVERAADLGYEAIAITDECSVAGIVKAHVRAAELNLKLIIGSQFTLSNGCKLIALCPNQTAYQELCGLITLARMRSPKGEYELHLDDLRFRLKTCLMIWLVDTQCINNNEIATHLKQAFPNRLWIGVHHSLQAGEQLFFKQLITLANKVQIRLVATGQIRMHNKSRKPLLDVLTAIRHNDIVQNLAGTLEINSEKYLKPLSFINKLYPKPLLDETLKIASQCQFSLDELRYQYPQELVPKSSTPIQYLRKLVAKGSKIRWPGGLAEKHRTLIEKELNLIEELHYEYYFLTVHDIVRFARNQEILCQGRGSAANSIVCYCLGITEISPDLINMLFERFISKERDEPPDIDVDFEHSRREEVIQYIYNRYGRNRAALTATVITYRARSAIRDVGKAVGLDKQLIDELAKSLAWWDRQNDLTKRVEEIGMRMDQTRMQQFYALVQQIRGFPRHLSQHVGGFLITQGQVSELVPIENASMPERTVIQWDKEDIESLGLLKVDVLGLGMLSALRRSMDLIRTYDPNIKSIADIPKEDPATYEMLCQGDSIGVFQVESRAQMSMLPRLKPRCFYDLVIEIAIVRPGPIQGDMVHPYLRRRDGKEAITYPSEDIREVLEPTLGVPLFQEQAIKLAMVAAGFSGGEADQLRRAMASWGKNGNLHKFEKKLIDGMLERGYTRDFSERLFEQIKGFGGYGFPESHSASFALLCYTSTWIKRHHPAVFYCSLLNSQPMGFYSPSQLIQDAQRHHVSVFPVDIQKSQWENCIEPAPLPLNQNHSRHSWAIRLGFSRIKGLNQDTCLKIESARKQDLFIDIEDLSKRAKIKFSELKLLAKADALSNLTGRSKPSGLPSSHTENKKNRYQASWEALGIEEERPLLNTTSEAQTTNNKTIHRNNYQLPTPSVEENVWLDYQTTGLSLRPHPMALLRHKTPFNRCKRYSELASLNSGRFVRVAGLVTGRQRPGTAKGTLFLTLEDETGNTNVIVWKRTQDHFRKPLLTAKLLMIKGTVETDNNVTHVVAGALIDLSDQLADIGIRSRDFH